MEQILDKTKTRLTIFTRNVEVNKNLPKWMIIEKETYS